MPRGTGVVPGPPPRLRALRSASDAENGHRVHHADPGVHDADLGVHDADPRVHDRPIRAFTMVRSWRSRWREIRNVVDAYTRECHAIEVDTSLTGTRVARVLDALVAKHGVPAGITVDNGPEFISRALDRWAYEHRVALHFIQPGKPIQNAHVESFNGRFRDECLSQMHFPTLARARAEIELWRVDYNTQRPHSALAYQTPEEFGRAVRASMTEGDRSSLKAKPTGERDPTHVGQQPRGNERIEVRPSTIM